VTFVRDIITEEGHLPCSQTTPAGKHPWELLTLQLVETESIPPFSGRLMTAEEMNGNSAGTQEDPEDEEDPMWRETKLMEQAIQSQLASVANGGTGSHPMVKPKPKPKKMPKPTRRIKACN
jgi:hypothetical protein